MNGFSVNSRVSLAEATPLPPVCREHMVPQGLRPQDALLSSLLTLASGFPGKPRSPAASLGGHVSLQGSSCRVCGTPVRTRGSTCWPLWEEGAGG